MKKYRTLKGFAVFFLLFTALALVSAVLFYNIDDLEFFSNIIEQLGQSLTGTKFTITSDVAFECQRWSMVTSAVMFVFAIIFSAAAFSRAEKVIKAVKYSQKAVIQTYTNTKKDRAKLQKKQAEEKKMKSKQERKAAKLAKKQAKELAKAEKVKKEAAEVKETPVVEKTPETHATAATTAQQKKINNILDSLK